MLTKIIRPLPGLGLLLISCLFSQAQEKKKEPKGELYGSWGYNKEFYTHSNLHVSQPSLGNQYVFNSVLAHDHPGWDDGVLNKAISIPQYNYRVGYIFNRLKGWGLEINFDHTKYIIEDQKVHMTGTFQGQSVDTLVTFNHASGFFWYLNNGANFLLFNFVKRWHVLSTRDKKFQVDFLGKAGVGPVIPHVENSLFGQKNSPHFQVGGWNTGVEGALRFTLFHYVFVEYTNKLDYARYSGLKIYEGTARQAFGTYEMILNLGFNFPVGKQP